MVDQAGIQIHGSEQTQSKILQSCLLAEQRSKVQGKKAKIKNPINNLISKLKGEKNRKAKALFFFFSSYCAVTSYCARKLS